MDRHELDDTDRGSPLSFAILLVAAAALRIAFNNVASYSPADETTYLRFTEILFSGGGYPRIVRMFIEDPALWVFPNPLRWSYLGATTLFCTIGGGCTYRTLATLSTVAGIACVALTYRIGLRLFDRSIALAAAALVATSPLQLALGRRALSDEFFCALVLASISTLIDAIDTPTTLRRMVFVATTTLAFAAKEQLLLIYPVILLFWWLRERKLRWEWTLPPFLFFAVFCALARDATSFFRIGRITLSAIGAPYAQQYQSGPPQRLLIDLLAIAPLVTMAFLAAALAGKRRQGLIVLAGGILVLHSFFFSKNIRYIVPADPLMRLVVASWLPPGRWRTVAIAVNAIVELLLFYAIFIAHGVYDPVTDQLLRALDMLPR